MMKYFVRILLSIVSGMMGFGLAFMLTFGLCFGNYSSGYCNGAGAGITLFAIPIIMCIAAWFLVAHIQRSSAQIDPSGVQGVTTLNTIPSDPETKVKQQSRLLLFSYLAVLVGIIRQIVLVWTFDRGYGAGIDTILTRIPSPILVALILSVVAILITQRNRRNVILATIVIVAGTLYGFVTFGRF